MCQRATVNGYEKAKAEFSAELTDARATIEKLNQELSACMRRCDAANAANSELEIAKCELNATVMAAKGAATKAKAAAKQQLAEALQAQAVGQERRMLRMVEKELRVRGESAEAEARLQMEAARAGFEAAEAEMQALPAALEAALVEARSLTRSRDMYRKRAVDFEAAEKERVVTDTARQREARRERSLHQLQLAEQELREERDTLRQRVTALETELGRARPAVGALAEDAMTSASTMATLIAPRTSGSSEAPLTARTCEYLRRICEETGGSFHGAATAIALVLDLFIEGGPTEEQLISNVSIKKAFDRLGMIDDDRERAINRASTAYWAMGADGGNKGRAIEMIAYCFWDEKISKPIARPLAASDLFCNQTAANGERTALRAVEHLGLKPELCSTFTTDGTTHAVQDAEGTLASLHALSAQLTEQRSAISNCCIHGAALAENAGLESAWPGDRVVGALRMLWEIVGPGEGGRRDEYRETWIVDCKFPAALFDSTLGSMPEGADVGEVAGHVRPHQEAPPHPRAATSQPARRHMHTDVSRALPLGQRQAQPRHDEHLQAGTRCPSSL